MDWLNYHHLLYFWSVAREGTIARACGRLGVAQPTVSGQIRALERSLGARLFDRVGRNLVLTETGRQVYRYADEIFALGRELQDAVKGGLAGQPLRLSVGIAEGVPDLLAYRILQPALELPQPAYLVCQRGAPERLAAQLALHELDVLLADAPINPAVRVRVFPHLLGECGVSFCAAPRPAAELRPGFPRSLDGAPFLLPPEGASLRRALDGWFEAQGIRPRVCGEFGDSALLKTFGQAGAGVFAVPSASEAENLRQYRVRVVGRVDSLLLRFYVITVERRLRHPAVAAISEAARRQVFG
jgi:LysR family transcriptional regulator, transcriptional activator of nhaA